MTWKEKLAGKLSRELAGEIDVYETQLELRKLGKIDEKLFAETRLRRGAYGQRYDNGQRYDGVKTQQLKFPCVAVDQRPGNVLGRAGHAADQNPVWRIDTGADWRRWRIARRNTPTAFCT